uniref:hypothetical protein n=1 Tax=Roseivirga sp. TaxID=1964215 RepID=UPI0040473609
MFIESQEVKAVKIVRIKEREAWRKAVWAKEHNMKLEELLHRELEERLRKIAGELEDLFGTGYVSVPYE